MHFKFISMVEVTNENVMRCAIWYHLYNLKNGKNAHGGMLLSVKLQAEAWCMTEIFYSYGIVSLTNCFSCLLPTSIFRFSLEAKLALTLQKRFYFRFRLYFALIILFLSRSLRKKTSLAWIMIDICCFRISITNCSLDVLILSNWIRLGNVFRTRITKSAKYNCVQGNCKVSTNFHQKYET